MRRRVQFAVSIVAALGCLAVAETVHAENWYASISSGMTFPLDVDAKSATQSSKIALDNGWAVGAAVGYDFKPIRVEAQLAYGENEVKTLSNPLVSGGAPQAGSGKATVLSGMANAYYDFLPDSSLRPYIGVGAGYTRFDANKVTAPGFTVLDDSDSVPAVQVMAGLAVDLSDSIALEIQYRFFASDDVEVKDNNNTRFNVDGARIHVAGAGLRFSF